MSSVETSTPDSTCLCDILKNGTLTDNQTYTISNDTITKLYPSQASPMPITHCPTCSKNNKQALFEFLGTASIVSSRPKDGTDSQRKVIVFDTEKYEHNTSDPLIRVIGTNPHDFTIRTGNLIGYITNKSYTLYVSSRFGDDFLRYMIADAHGFLELEHYGGMSNDGYYWLLIYLWNTTLKQAYHRLGLPKSYINKNEHTAKVRRQLNLIDYFQYKTLGTYQCSYREHSYDTPPIALFIHAHKNTREFPFWKSTRNIYNTLLYVSQGKKRTYKELLSTKHFTNPFYKEYNTLIDLSKKIITHAGTGFDTTHTSSTFLFDVSMLFEYFIRKLIEKNHDIQLQSKYTTRKIPTGGIPHKKRALKPDLVFKGKGKSGLYVFDVKYKYFDFTNGAKREDLFQLHTYVGQWSNECSIAGCGLIYPCKEKDYPYRKEDATQQVRYLQDTLCISNKSIPFYILFLIIPTQHESPSFTTYMNKQCRIFTDTIQSITNNNN